MRSARNVHPEWGYLSPTSSLMRSFRIALVSTAIGATSGAAVVISLIERPGSGDGNPSLSAHTLVTEMPVITAPAAAGATRGSAQSKPLTPDIPSPPSVVVPASDTAAGPAETPRSVEPAPPSSAPAAKVVARKKSSPRRHHWQAVANGRNYRHYDRQFGPPFQFPDSRPFVQLGFGQTGNEW
jgi:hypothetical protein